MIDSSANDETEAEQSKINANKALNVTGKTTRFYVTVCDSSELWWPGTCGLGMSKDPKSAVESFSNVNDEWTSSQAFPGAK